MCCFVSAQVAIMTWWIIQVTVMMLSTFIHSSQSKRDAVLYCSGKHCTTGVYEERHRKHNQAGWKDRCLAWLGVGGESQVLETFWTEVNSQVGSDLINTHLVKLQVWCLWFDFVISTLPSCLPLCGWLIKFLTSQ